VRKSECAPARARNQSFSTSVDVRYSRGRNALLLGRSGCNAAVAGNLYRIATSDKPGTVTAAIFWLKTRAGWRDVQQVEHGRANEFAQMTDEELREIVREGAREMGMIEAPKLVVDKTPAWKR
jgi:hypothetical protein